MSALTDAPDGEAGSPRRELLLLGTVVVVGCLAILVGAALVGDEPPDESTDPDPPAEEGSVLAAVPGRTGGDLVVAAQDWPACLNPLRAECDSEWLHWTVAQHVLPKLMELDPSGSLVASPLLTEAPSQATGDIVEDPFSVTYRLDPDARWDDGTPITAADIAFTWRAYLQTRGGNGAEGYDRIVAVDQVDAHTVVLRFSEPYAAWAELFGGANGYVLKATAFLSTDTSRDLRDSVPFSAGPWRLEGWDDSAAVLVPNTSYWDLSRIPRVDRVEVVHRPDRTADPDELLGEDAAAVFRPRVGAVVRPDDDADQRVSIRRSPTYEAIWFNQVGPLADPAVREALTRALGRAAMVADVVRPDFPELPILQCVGWVPTLGSWCSDADYAEFLHDPDEARRVLVQAGYRRGADGIFEDPDGVPLEIRWTVAEADPAAVWIQAIGYFQAREAGIRVVPDNVADRVALTDRVERREYQIAQYSRTATADPSVTRLFHCDRVAPPGTANPDGNLVGWCDDEVSAVMDAIDSTVDPARRVDLVRQVARAVVAARVALPLYQRPALVAWRPGLVSGPVDAYGGSPYGAYANLWAWALPEPVAEPDATDPDTTDPGGTGAG